MKKVLSVIAPIDFQDKEYGDSKAAIESGGHQVLTASTSVVAHGKFGAVVDVDVLLADVNSDDYDAVVFIGGPGCFEYFDDPTTLNIAQDFYNDGKLTTAICAAPSILANAGLLEGKTVTCWDGEAKTLGEAGANYTGNSVEKDGLIITGEGPMAATEFGEKVAKALM